MRLLGGRSARRLRASPVRHLLGGRRWRGSGKCRHGTLYPGLEARRLRIRSAWCRGQQLGVGSEEIRVHDFAGDGGGTGGSKAGMLDDDRDRDTRRFGWRERDEPGVVAVLLLDLAEAVVFAEIAR